MRDYKLNEQIGQVLQRPYPHLDSPKLRLGFVVFLGFSSCLFLLLFNPYDALNWTFESPISYTLPLWTAGLFAIPILLLSQFWLRPLFVKTTFRVQHLIVLSLLELILLGMLCFLLFADQPSMVTDFWGELYTTFFYTFLLASIVYVFAYLCLPYVSMTAKTSVDKLQVGEEPLPELLNLHNEKGKVELVVKADALLYLKAEDNYVSVFHLLHDSIKKELIRTSLKKIGQQVPEKRLLRVHRSYMINPQKIVRIEPTKDAFKLSLAGLEEFQIPVSATYKESLQAIRSESAF